MTLGKKNYPWPNQLIKFWKNVIKLLAKSLRKYKELVKSSILLYHLFFPEKSIDFCQWQHFNLLLSALSDAWVYSRIWNLLYKYFSNVRILFKYLFTWLIVNQFRIFLKKLMWFSFNYCRPTWMGNLRLLFSHSP